MTMKKPTTKKAQTTEGKAVVYIGPTLGGGALMRNAVFRAGEFPPHIASMRERARPCAVSLSRCLNWQQRESASV